MTTIKAASGTYRINASLARAAFKRVGSHLKIILEDESEILLEDYYSHDSPAIVDPGGQTYNSQAQATAAYTPLSETSFLDETHAHEFDDLDSIGGLIHLDGLDRSPSASLSTRETEFFSTFSSAPQAEQGSTFQAQAPALPDMKISVSEADGHAGLAVPAGWSVIEGGTGAYGHIEQLDGAWVFVLDRPYDHDPVQGRNIAQGADSVRILMADPAGGVRYMEIPVSIEDDIPAQSESESLIQLPEILPQGAFFPLSIAGKEARGDLRTDLAGDIAFTPGADGARFVWGDGEPDSQGNFAPLVGQFGILIGNIDGSYVYTNNENSARSLIPGEIGRDTFRVRYQDADGDFVTHTLTVARTGQDDPITIISKDEPLTVWESALPEGTDPDPARLAASGALKFCAPDGITKITLTTTATGTHELDLHGGECRLETNAWTAIFRRSALGEISYNFQLTGPVHHDENSDIAYTDFNLALHDRSGSQIKGIKIPLAIVDDGPLAPEPISYEITDSGISGSLMDHIQAGADGAGGFFNWEKRADLAAYGSWTTDRQGNYSFEPDHSLPAFLALRPGESIEVPIGYRFTDADNDWVEGKINLTITGIDHPVSIIPQGSEIPEDADPLGPNCGVDAAGNAFARVFESGLDGQLAPRKASGTIAIEAPDGLESLTISYGGKDYDLLAGNATINLDCGQLTAKLVNGHIAYSFLLKSGASHPESGADSVYRELQIHAVNASGNQAHSRLVLQIVDDTPRAWGLGSDADGNAWLDFSLGADRGAGAHLEITAPDGTTHAVDSWNLTEIAGTYGRLSIDLNGNYRYDGKGGQDVFKIAIVDADGDRVTTDLDGGELRLEFGEAPKEPVVLKVNLTAHEVAIGEPVKLEIPDGLELSGGFAGKLGHIEVIDGNAFYILDAPVLNQSGQVEILHPDLVRYESEGDTVTVYSNAQVAGYVRDASQARNSGKGADTLRLEATGADGQPYVIELTVDVADGGPSVRVPESGAMWGNDTYYGQLPENWYSFGADDGEGAGVIITFDGYQYLYEPGKTNVFMGWPDSLSIGGRRVLTIHEDGSFEIGHSIAGGPKEGKIGITVIDADGSRAYGEFQVSQADVPWQKSYNHKEDDETHTASNWLHEIIGQTVDLGDAYVAYMDSYEIIQNGAHGTAYFVPKFENNSNSLDLVYRLDEAIDKRQYGYENGNTFLRVDVDTIVIRYTAGGKDLYYTYNIDVFDHGPTISATLDDGAPATWPGHVDVVFGGSVAGKWSHDYGPDTWGETVLKCVMDYVPGEGWQEYVISADADTRIDGKHGALTLHADGTWQYDSRGETSGLDSFHIKIQDSDGDTASMILDFNIPEAETGILELAATAREADMGQALALEIPDGFTLAERVDGQYGHVEMLDGKAVYILDRPAMHEGGDVIAGADTLDFRVADASGRTLSVALTIDIEDDRPQVLEAAKPGLLVPGETFTGTLGDWYSFGADSGAGASLWVRTNFSSEFIEISRTETTDVRYGSIVMIIEPDGSYSLRNESTNSATGCSFEFMARDADGDMASFQMPITWTFLPHDRLGSSQRMPEADALRGRSIYWNFPAPHYDSVEVLEQGRWGMATIEPMPGKDDYWNIIYKLNGPLDRRLLDQDSLEGGFYNDADSITIRCMINGKPHDAIIRVHIRDSVPKLEFLNPDGSSHDFMKGIPAVAGESVDGSYRLDFGVDNLPEKSMVMRITHKDGSWDSIELDSDGPNVIRGDYGTLTLNADGTYHYEAESAGKENFWLFVTDSDGDKTSQFLYFNVEAAPDPIVPLDLDVTEAGGSSEILIPDGYAIQAVDTDGQLGHAEHKDGKWIYILDGPVDSGAIQGANTLEDADSVSLMLTDPDGNTVRGVVKVSVTDDIPEISSPGADVLSGSTVSGQLEIAYGADGPGNLAVNGNAIADSAKIAGTFGTLTINPNGTWSYQASPLAAGEPGGQETFAVQIADGDGDLAGSALVLTIVKPEAPEITAHAQGDEKHMGEAALFTGIPEGYHIVAGEYQGEYSRIVSNAGKAGLIIDRPFSHDQGEDARAGADTISVRIADAAGNEWDIPVNVDIADDAPAVFSMKDYEGIRTGETLSGQLEFSWGADDGPGRIMEAKINGGEYVTVGEKGATLGGFNGTVFVTEDGFWRYTAGLDPDSRAKDEVFFRITDADGDQAESWLGFEIEEPIVKAAGEGDMVLRESQLYGGDAFCQFLVKDGWEPEEREFQGQYGRLSYRGIDPESGRPALVYTLGGPFRLGEEGMGETWREVFAVEFTDHAGSWKTETLAVTVMDDCIQIRALESAGGSAAIGLPDGWTLADVTVPPLHGSIEGSVYIPDTPVFDSLLARADLFEIAMSDGSGMKTVKVGVEYINDVFDEILSEQAGGQIALDMDGWRVREVLADGSYGHAEQEGSGWIYRFGGEVTGEAGETVYDTIGLRYQNGQTGETIDLDMRVGIINDVEDDLTGLLAPAPAMTKTFYCLSGHAISGQLPEYPGDPDQGIELVTSDGKSILTIDEGPIDTGSGEFALDPDGTWHFVSSGSGTLTLKLPDGTACQIISIEDEGTYNDLVYGSEPGGDVLIGDAWADPGDLEMLAYRQEVELQS